jgi:hypothetical protein
MWKLKKQNSKKVRNVLVLKFLFKFLYLYRIVYDRLSNSNKKSDRFCDQSSTDACFNNRLNLWMNVTLITNIGC